MDKTVKLRFYGRFAYVQAFDKDKNGNDVAAPKISVVAPRFDETRFGKHRAQMTVRRDQVKLRREQTGLSPSLRVLSDDADVLKAELFTWDLSGCNVSFGDATRASATFKSTNGGREILDLGKLEAFKNRKAQLDGQALMASRGGKSQAVIEVTQGDGVALPVVATDRGQLLPHGAALVEDNSKVVMDPGPPPKPRDFELLDLVEFTIKLPTGEDTLTFRIRHCDGSDGIVTVFAGSENDPDPQNPVTNEVIVSFSHMCSSLPKPITYDFEYSQYYSLLRQHPADEALILKPSQGAGEGGDCGFKATVRFNRADGSILDK